MAKKKPIPAENSNNFFKAGWKPDIEIDQTTGKGSIVHVGTDPNYQNRLDDVIREWGFDPKEYEIDGILNHTFMAKKPIAILTDANFWSSIS